MHTVVSQPLTVEDVGSISCRPLGLEPIVFEWSGDGRESFVFDDDSKSEARNVPPGRYRIRATDAAGNRVDVTVDVRPLLSHAVRVTEYRTVPASTRFARDGSVEAVVRGARDGVRYLWTSGVTTDVPCLSDVPQGTYSVVAVTSTDACPATILDCAPARVGVR